LHEIVHFLTSFFGDPSYDKLHLASRILCCQGLQQRQGGVFAGRGNEDHLEIRIVLAQHCLNVVLKLIV
jgi:hypothetical protein